MATLSLTSAGEKKAEDGDANGAKGAMLALLYERGPTDLEELALELNTSDHKCTMIARSLINAGYVKGSD